MLTYRDVSWPLHQHSHWTFQHARADLVLRAAVATVSEFVVTFNARDVREGVERYGIGLLTPGEALGRLGVQS